MTDDYAYVDHARLVSDLKAEDGRAVAWAYASVFSSQVGRLVLTHQLAEAGVGTIRGPGLSAEDSRYHDGRADHAQHLCNLAGFGRMSVAHAVTADILEGRDNDGQHTDTGNDSASGDTDASWSGPDRDYTPD